METKVGMGPVLLSLLCVLLHQGVATAECPQACTADYNPVCGNDAETYSNKCQLDVKKCESDSSLAVLFTGECECRQNVACTREYDPHCGTDGKTYGNRCGFAAAKLCSTTGLKLERVAECVPSVECPEACTADYTPVCGNDGETYSNLCALNVKKCESDLTLATLFPGECECRQDVACTMEFDPYCGNDGKTYGNKCGFAVAKLCSTTGLKLEKRGACDESAADAVKPLAVILITAALAALTITY